MWFKAIQQGGHKAITVDGFSTVVNSTAYEQASWKNNYCSREAIKEITTWENYWRWHDAGSYTPSAFWLLIQHQSSAAKYDKKADNDRDNDKNADDADDSVNYYLQQ